jgi:hypothetical protein
LECIVAVLLVVLLGSGKKGISTATGPGDDYSRTNRWEEERKGGEWEELSNAHGSEGRADPFDCQLGAPPSSPNAR